MGITVVMVAGRGDGVGDKKPQSCGLQKVGEWVGSSFTGKETEQCGIKVGLIKRLIFVFVYIKSD